MTDDVGRRDWGRLSYAGLSLPGWVLSVSSTVRLWSRSRGTSPPVVAGRGVCIPLITAAADRRSSRRCQTRRTTGDGAAPTLDQPAAALRPSWRRGAVAAQPAVTRAAAAGLTLCREEVGCGGAIGGDSRSSLAVSRVGAARCQFRRPETSAPSGNTAGLAPDLAAVQRDIGRDTATAASDQC